MDRRLEQKASANRLANAILLTAGLALPIALATYYCYVTHRFSYRNLVCFVGLRNLARYLNLAGVKIPTKVKLDQPLDASSADFL